jgi:hypothetical protein
MATAPPLWNSPQPGAPPAAQATPFTKRCETLGTLSLALAALEGLACFQRLMGPIFGKAILNFEKGIMPKTPGGPSFDDIVGAGKDLLDKIVIWEAVRAVPFLVATCVLGWIALRLRKAEPAALRAARTWSLAALGVVALSALIQIFVTIPATMEYQQAIVRLMPKIHSGSSAPPIDMDTMMSRVTLISSIVTLLGGIAFMSAWPIVLYVWAGKILKDAPGEG